MIDVDESHGLIIMYAAASENTYLFRRWTGSIDISWNGNTVNVQDIDVEEFIKSLRASLRQDEPEQ